MPNKPSTLGPALDDRWTRYCLEIAGRRAFGWVVVGAVAFVLQLALILVFAVDTALPAALLLFSVLVLGYGLTRRPPRTELLGDHAWVHVRVHWSAGLLVVHGPRPLVLDVSAGPLARGRINRHRRAWVVAPDRTGNTVVTFRGVPKLFPAKVVRR
ncbi:hypothetical protein LZG04_19460 [Saccharothrix sp. S26]|uniref:hypothetical protein n=1 Tax=Saccharothrix sp. S26 TaxID=2907215 RepID=UPI001F15F4E3|nr:hypothetical protein [Saccharothrix sp. S26]MCE6996964.1 hypothetical protein [Saccharothrix sp. S26]